MSANNCPTEVITAFEDAGLDVEADNFSRLQRLKGQKFTPVLKAVLDCSVCSSGGGLDCAESVATDVIEVASMKDLIHTTPVQNYFERMKSEVDNRTRQLMAGE